MSSVQKRGTGLKSKPPPVVAVVTNINYAVVVLAKGRFDKHETEIDV